MLVSWNWLKNYVALDMEVSELENRLAMAGLNHEGTESVGDDLADHVAQADGGGLVQSRFELSGEPRGGEQVAKSIGGIEQGEIRSRDRHPETGIARVAARPAEAAALAARRRNPYARRRGACNVRARGAK